MIKTLFELFIMIHLMGFEMINEFGWNYQHWGFGFALLYALLGIILIISILFIDFLIITGFYYLVRRISITLRTKEIRNYNVIGRVTSKDYQPAYTTYSSVSIGKTTTIVPHHHSEKYIVGVEYKDMIEYFYSETLYNCYELNDSIPLVLIHKLDKNQNIIEKALELKD